MNSNASEDSAALDFVRDSVVLLRARLRDAVSDHDARGAPFDDGRVLALREALLILQTQAQAFGIPLERIGLDFDVHGS